MEKSVTERVNEFRESTCYSILAFSKVIGVNQTTLNKQLREGGCGVSVSTLTQILSTYPDLSAEWLLRGEGDMVKGVVEKDGRGTVKAIGQQDLVDALKDHIAELKDHIAELKADKQHLLAEVNALRREKSLSDGFGYPMVAEEIEYNKNEG